MHHFRGRLLSAGLALLVSASCSKKKDEDRSEPTAPAPAPRADAAPEPESTLEPTLDNARALAKRVVMIDGHIDLPWRLSKNRDESGEPTDDPAVSSEGDFDHPRAVAGGLDAPFMSIYVPASYQERGGAKKFADELIDMVVGIAKEHPDKFALATSPDQILANVEAGLVSLPMGIENGAAIEDDLANLDHFHSRGVRYITLTHSKDNRIGDSSYDGRGTHGGLSKFGRRVVAEMNRLGIMIDVSHVSDATFDDVLEATEVPVIASHSSARHFVPGFERNMSDDSIRKLGENGGVIMINFGSAFVTRAANEANEAAKAAVAKYTAEKKLPGDAPEVAAFKERWRRENPYPFATASDVADHIDRVKELAGIDHIGFGSDYDGVGDSLPEGLKDPSDYPNLIRILLERGYSAEDIEKIAGGNLLRVWREVEAHAAEGDR